VPLKCLGDQWTTSIVGTGNSWVIAPFSGDSAGADPSEAFEDSTHLYQPGAYTPFTNTTITFDGVDTLGYANVRLQYRRWLSVEDGFFDHASILADGVEVWGNYASAEETGASFAHIDKEWRFHDVDLSAFVDDGVVELGFALTSDQGLEFGGWTAGSLCIVAFDDALVTCGNGLLDEGETCDDGNLLSGDGCSDACQTEGPGPSTTGGSSETSDSVGSESESGGSDTDTDSAGFDGEGLLDRGCACTTGGSGAPFFALVLLAVRRRRR
jgi:MYXO-CTERM domain-containing protein